MNLELSKAKYIKNHLILTCIINANFGKNQIFHSLFGRNITETMILTTDPCF